MSRRSESPRHGGVHNRRPMVFIATHLRRRPSRRTGKELLVQILLIAVGFFFLIPIVYLVSMSLKSPDQWITDPLNPIPRPFTTGNLETFFDVVDVRTAMSNTLLITTLATAGTVASCSLVAYPLSRIAFRGRNVVTFLILATMLLPAQVLMIPQYLLFLQLGWIDTFFPLVLPPFFAVNAFIVFYLRQSFRTIPRELDEAVLVDGGTRWTVFRRIIIPLSRGPILIATLLQGIAVYNDYFFPLLYLHSPERQTMAIAVPLAGASVPGVTAAPVIAVGTLLFVLPVLVIFLMTQRSLTGGVRLSGGVKG